MVIERQYVTPKEAAVILDCHVQTVIRNLKAGKLTGLRLGRTWRVSIRSVRLQASQQQNALRSIS